MFTDYLPKGFTCAGCTRASWKSVCEFCKENLPWNDDLLPSPVTELESIAPLMYSFSRSQTLIRRFKEYGGSDLKRALFQMQHPLKHRLMESHFFAVIPIPQDLDRSYTRGHESGLTVAKYFSQQLRVPLLPLLTLRSRNTARQTGLRKFEREWSENPFVFSDVCNRQWAYHRLRDHMESRKEVRLLLVDDLITSGSTLSKACSTLREFYPNLKIWGGSIGFRPSRRFH